MSDFIKSSLAQTTFSPLPRLLRPAVSPLASIIRKTKCSFFGFPPHYEKRGKFFLAGADLTRSGQ